MTGPMRVPKTPKDRGQIPIKYQYEWGILCIIQPEEAIRKLRETHIYAARAFTRAERREILRETVFLCKMPFETPRCISGCAWRRASRALSESPAAIAVSTFFTNVRIRPMRALLIDARLALRMIRFLEDLWFAIAFTRPCT